MEMVDRDAVTRMVKRARRVGAPKPRLAAVLAVAIAIGTLGWAPAALATATDYQWTGSDATSPNWAQTDNWAGGASPSGSIGTLSFPDLGAACDSGSSSDACYKSDDQLGSLTANQLDIDDDQAYSISTDNASALTLDGGLSAAPTETASDNMNGDPTLSLPIVLGADQTWNIDGGVQSGYYGISVPQISGSHTLNVSFTNDGTLTTTAISNTAVVADGNGALVVPAGGDFGSGGTTIENDASLFVEGSMSPSASEGPLTVSGTQNSQPTVAIEAGAAPDARLVASNVSLDPSTNLYLELDDDDHTLDAAGNPQGFSQLAAVNVNLGGATLTIDQGAADQSGDCVTLSPGDTFPVITATGTLSGDLTYTDNSNNFDTLAPGQTSQPLPVSFPGDCSDGFPDTSALATLTYTAKSIIATVVPNPTDTSTSTTSGTGGGTSDGGNSPTTATGKTAAQIKAALGKIGHPSGAREIREFTKSGVFKVRFTAPTRGELSITWKATVVTDAGKHRKRRTITVATGSGHSGGKGAIHVTVHLTSAGRGLLKRKHHLAITGTNRFKPTGDGWTTVTKHFSL